MTVDNNRLLLEIDKTIRNVNRDHINSAIPEIQLADLDPILDLVAQSRATYLRTLFDVAAKGEEGPPSPEQIKRLRYLRLIHDELLAGAQALETAIQRGYLDVSPV